MSDIKLTDTQERLLIVLADLADGTKKNEGAHVKDGFFRVTWIGGGFKAPTADVLVRLGFAEESYDPKFGVQTVRISEAGKALLRSMGD